MKYVTVDTHSTIPSMHLKKDSGQLTDAEILQARIDKGAKERASKSIPLGDYFADSYGNFRLRKVDSKGGVIPDSDLDAENAPLKDHELL